MNKRKNAISYADKEFSLYIRARDGKCLICGAVFELDCSHYITRSKHGTRWSEQNCHSQCRGCHNDYHAGSDAYREAIERRYGEYITEYLRRLGSGVVKFSTSEIKDIGRMYKEKRKSL